MPFTRLREPSPCAMLRRSLGLPWKGVRCASARGAPPTGFGLPFWVDTDTHVDAPSLAPIPFVVPPPQHTSVR